MEDHSKPETTTFGLSTFENLGNSCYLNTALQSLFHIVPFSQALFDDEENYPAEDFSDSYLTLLKAYWEDNYYLTPNTFHQIFTQTFPNYLPLSQNDASEALLFILDQLHEATALPLPPSRNPSQSNTPKPINLREYLQYKADKQWRQHFSQQTSPVLQFLTGQEHYRLQCLNCRKVSHQFSAFNHISLPLRKTSETLTQLLDLYWSKEQFDQDNQWLCDNCNHRTRAYRKTTFRRFPPFLIIILKRFTRTYSSTRKNPILIDYPLRDLDLNKYLRHSQNLLSYRLITVGCHQGSANSGHYYSINQNIDGQFYLYNDEAEPQLLSSTSLVTPDAYFLIYTQQK
jgi:ubiquitin C-terminal hydrolase